jgi:hypothetical protein
MNTELEDLLSRLEQVSAEAAESSNPLLAGAIEERGKLIEQIQPVLASHVPLSYSEWNRLVIVHHQGSRIQENLENIRNQVVLELGGNTRGRLFLERVTSMISPALDQG